LPASAVLGASFLGASFFGWVAVFGASVFGFSTLGAAVFSSGLFSPCGHAKAGVAKARTTAAARNFFMVCSLVPWVRVCHREPHPTSDSFPANDPASVDALEEVPDQKGCVLDLV